MALLLIPTFSDPLYSQTVVLEGTEYLLEFRWNQREASWYLDIHQPDETLLASVKLVTNWPLLRKFTDTRLPPGEIFAQADPAGDTTNPGLDDFGQGLRVNLLYVTSDGL